MAWRKRAFCFPLSVETGDNKLCRILKEHKANETVYTCLLSVSSDKLKLYPKTIGAVRLFIYMYELFCIVNSKNGQHFYVYRERNKDQSMSWSQIFKVCIPSSTNCVCRKGDSDCKWMQVAHLL